MGDNSDSVPENPNVASERKQGGESVTQQQGQEVEQVAVDVRTSGRIPFGNLSQVDADLALARRLQEQERAYMMLTMNNRVFGSGRNLFGVVEEDDDDFDDEESVEFEDDTGINNNTNNILDAENGHRDDENDDVDFEDDNVDSDEEDDDDTNNVNGIAPNARNGINQNHSPETENNALNEDDFDEHLHDDGEDDDEDDDDDDDDVDYEEEYDDDQVGVEFDPELYPDDEAYARALQDHEERELIVRIADLISGVGDHENPDGIAQNLQEMWDEIDPDELTYEELIALGEVVGTENRGLSADTIASLPSIDFKAHSNQTGTNDLCVICRLEYEDGEPVTLLSCKHSYHAECINDWLKIKKICPVCSTEVSTS